MMTQGPELETLEAFLESMARLASAVHIVTVRHGGRDYGMTVTAVTSLSTDPVSILLSINRQAAAHDAILATGELGVSTLRPGQSGLARTFAGMTGVCGEARFAEGDWDTGSDGPPVLRDAASMMRCRVLQSHVIGTHRIFACKVEQVVLGHQPHALVYGNRQFGTMAYAED
ncbi:flavin reductase [Pelagerythrobacter aerophilus]|uniref:Flavin reductase n=2 Tax=Pelagerythrobacter aerophilus TaxID=2306995 RepID=A0A418NHL7_9SPHN|nr:flavin reductase [Pelagerythrobacter aerophilus]